jgi:hypothetical protein
VCVYYIYTSNYCILCCVDIVIEHIEALDVDAEKEVRNQKHKYAKCIFFFFFKSFLLHRSCDLPLLPYPLNTDKSRHARIELRCKEARCQSFIDEMVLKKRTQR